MIIMKMIGNLNIWAALFVIVFAACTNDDTALQGTAVDNSLHASRNTPVKLITALEDEEDESDKTYAAGEITKESKISAKLYIYKQNIDGTSEVSTKSASDVDFDGISGLNLTLNDFPNQNEWTVLCAETNQDCVYGWSQVTFPVDNVNTPVLTYQMKHARAKLTVKLKEKGKDGFLELSDKVKITINAETSTPKVLGTNGNDFQLIAYRQSGNIVTQEYLLEMPTKLGGNLVETEKTALVPATSIYVENVDGTYTQETRNDEQSVLTVVVEDTYESLTGDQVGGIYSVSLKDITIDGGSKLTKLEAGHHYVITLTLTHNKVLSATASFTDWNNYETDNIGLGNDASKVENNG